MATLILRIPKGAPLTNAELDANFVELDNTKIQLGGDIGGSTSSPVVVKLRGRSISTATPTTGQALVYTGTEWSPQDVTATGGSISSTVTSIVTSTVTNAVINTITSTVSTTVTNYPAFAVYLDAAQTSQTIIGNGSQQKILWNAEEFDTNNNFASNKFTPTVAGYYQLNAAVRVDGGTLGTGENMITIWKNGQEYHRGWNNTGMVLGNTWATMTVSALAYANGSTDYFEVFVQHGSSGNLTLTRGSNISWFNGIFVPTQLITNVAGTSVVTNTVSNAVSSTVITSAIDGGGRITTVLNDVSNFFNGKRKVFTLKSGQSAIVEGVNYRDNRDLSVIIGGRYYYAEVPQTTTLGPWMVDYVAGRTYEFKVTGSKLIFYREIAGRQGAEIRINNISSSRQKRSRYPFTANSIVLGE